MSYDWLYRYTAHSDTGLWSDYVVSCDGWRVATDKISLVAVRDGKLGPSKIARPSDVVRPYLMLQPTESFVCSLDDILTFAGCVRWSWCEACQGRAVSPDVVCPECVDGRWLPAVPEGKVDGWLGYVAGVLVDLSRLAWALAPEMTTTGEAVRVGRGEAPYKQAVTGLVIVDGDGWRVVVMGMSDTAPANVGRVFPSFHPDPLFAQMYLDRESDAGRGALADWLTDADDPFAKTLRTR